MYHAMSAQAHTTLLNRSEAAQSSHLDGYGVTITWQDSHLVQAQTVHMECRHVRLPFLKGCNVLGCQTMRSQACVHSANTSQSNVITTTKFVDESYPLQITDHLKARKGYLHRVSAPS
jgi:hypothetical protein